MYFKESAFIIDAIIHGKWYFNIWNMQGHYHLSLINFPFGHSLPFYLFPSVIKALSSLPQVIFVRLKHMLSRDVYYILLLLICNVNSYI